MVGRYQTKRGKRVERRFGWDTHGLPAELEAMKQLGMTEQDTDRAMGIDKFNDACRASVMKYAGEWRDYVTRQARWVDFDNDYKTLNVDYMESVLWAFKQLHEKGLTYNGYRVLPYCWKDETPLSNHELRMDDDVYKNRQDPAVTVGLRLETGELALAWTTTPGPCRPTWPRRPARHRLRRRRAGRHRHAASATSSARPASRAYAKDLFGDDVDPASPPPHRRPAHRRRPARPVVHAAVLRLRGARDARTASSRPTTSPPPTARASSTPPAPTVRRTRRSATRPASSRSCPSAPDCRCSHGPARHRGHARLRRQQAHHDHLKAAPAARATPGRCAPARCCCAASYEHSYPHCWRCRNPLIYRAVSSWYVEVTKFKDRMPELNQDINWTPANVKDGQFGKWLANARDWSISRNRYWGSPIPVWQSNDPEYPRLDVYGSFAEIERDFGVLTDADLHRPFIDEPDPAQPRRPDGPVGDAPRRGRLGRLVRLRLHDFGQVHYPFQNEAWFDTTTPATSSSSTSGRPAAGSTCCTSCPPRCSTGRPSQTCISHGIVLGSTGRR